MVGQYLLATEAGDFVLFVGVGSGEQNVLKTWVDESW